MEPTFGAQKALLIQIHAYSLAARIVVILHLLPVFPLAHPPATGYISGSVDVSIFAAKGEGSPTCPPFAGHRWGRSLRNTKHSSRLGPPRLAVVALCDVQLLH